MYVCVCVIKINLAPARFELGSFCLERIIYSTEPQPMLYIIIYSIYAIHFPI